MANETIVNRIIDADIEIITNTINEMLAKSSPVTAADVFEKVESLLQNKLTKTIFCPALSANISAGRVPGFYSKRGPHGGIFKGERSDVPVVRQKVIVPPPRATAAPAGPLGTLIGPDPQKDTKIITLESNDGTIIAEVPKEIKESKPYFATKKSSTEQKKEPLKNSLYDANEKFFMFIDNERYEVPCNRIYVNVLLEKVFELTESELGNVVFLDKKYTCEDTALLERTLMWFLNAGIIRKTGDPNRGPSVVKPKADTESEEVTLSPRLVANS